jgi:thiol-disulfide isomerase/thioredoxin
MALLAENEAAMFALTSYAAESRQSLTILPVGSAERTSRLYLTGKLTAVKPNLQRFEAWRTTTDAEAIGKNDPPQYVFTSDGKRGFLQFGDQVTPRESVAPDSLVALFGAGGGFYTRARSTRTHVARLEKENHLRGLRVAGREQFEGTNCEVVVYSYVSTFEGRTREVTRRHFLGADHLERRIVETTTVSGRVDSIRDTAIRAIRTNFPPPDAAFFAYTPPTNARVELELLSAGTPAPDFTANDRDGNPVRLSDFNGKVVVLDFWATWCGPCVASMPETNAVAKKYAGRGLVVLGVNVWDEPDAFKSWLPQNARYDAIRFLLDPNGKNGKDVAKNLYNVSGIPTQYVIDKQGVIRASFRGAPPRAKLERTVEGLL